MSKITISRGDDTQLTPHFKASEFYSKASNAPASHDFYTECVEAVEFLRAHYGVAWRITSTYRPDSIGSQHRECRAVDSQDTKSYKGHGSAIIKDLVEQLLNSKSDVFRQLRKLGINGFGVYDTFVHLDCRTAPLHHSDEFGYFDFWDERTKKKASTVASQPKKSSQPTKLVTRLSSSGS